MQLTMQQRETIYEELFTDPYWEKKFTIVSTSSDAELLEMQRTHRGHIADTTEKLSTFEEFRFRDRSNIPKEPLRHKRARRGLGKRYRAAVWDPETQSSVHLGFYLTSEQRDEAVRMAKGRRALGLPLRDSDVAGEA